MKVVLVLGVGHIYYMLFGLHKPASIYFDFFL